jgi:hypothetical protein
MFCAIFPNSAEQFRSGTRAFCAGCGTCLLPALTIADGTPEMEPALSKTDMEDAKRKPGSKE